MGEDLIGDRIFFNNDKFAIDINGEVCKPTIEEDVCKCIFFYKHKEKWVRFECLLCGIENATDEKVESIKQFAKGFFIKESENSMITDKQGREWLFKQLYDAGWQYVVADKYDNIYLANEKPLIYNKEIRMSSCEKAMGASAFKDILPKLNRNECISIAEELGITDWSKVAVDTPIYVREHESNAWEKRHFAFFKNGRVYSWLSGVTSWTADDENYVFSWKYAKVAEV